MTRPAVSVVVPCYNAGRFLDGLLASLAAQTFRDFEIVIVNNGSTDAETQRKLASLETVVRVIHQENRYLPGARNTGFREARADFILPLDADDTLEPSFLAEAYAILRDAPPDIGFVFAHMRLTGSLDGVLPRHFNYFDQLFLNQLPYCMLIRKSAWLEIGGYDETMTNGTEDWEFNIRLARSGYRGEEIPKPLFIYNARTDGMLMSHSSRIHGTIWHHIRDKHAALYRLPKLLSIWKSTRERRSRISLVAAGGLLALAKLLPDSWFNRLFHRLHGVARARRIGRGELQPLRPGPPSSTESLKVPIAKATVADNSSPLREKEIAHEKSNRRAISYLRLAISVFLVASAAYVIGLRDFGERFAQVNVVMMALGLLLFSTQVLVVAWRFRVILELGFAKISFARALEVTALSLIANFVLVTNLAGLVFRIVALRNPESSMRQLIIATLVERVIVFVVLIVAAVLSAFWLHLRVELLPLVLIGAGTIAVSVVAAGIAWFLVRRKPDFIKKIRYKWRRTAHELVSYAGNPRKVVSAFVITLVSHLIFLAAALAVARGSGINLDILDLAAALSATMLLASLPISISGWGVREVSLVLLLGYLGIDASTALAYSVIIGILSLLAAAIVGAASTVIDIQGKDDVAV